MPRVRADVHIDADQGQRKTYMLCCPNCRQKLADVESIRGIVEMRFMCRRCGKYIKAEIIGVDGDVAIKSQRN